MKNELHPGHPIHPLLSWCNTTTSCHILGQIQLVSDWHMYRYVTHTLGILYILIYIGAIPRHPAASQCLTSLHETDICIDMFPAPQASFTSSSIILAICLHPAASQCSTSLYQTGICIDILPTSWASFTSSSIFLAICLHPATSQCLTSLYQTGICIHMLPTPWASFTSSSILVRYHDILPHPGVNLVCFVLIYVQICFHHPGHPLHPLLFYLQYTYILPHPSA